MGMKKSAYMSMFMAMAAMGSSTYGGATDEMFGQDEHKGKTNFGELTKSEEKEYFERKRIEVERNERKKKLGQGLTEFFYGDHSLWSRNQKSADKKAMKKGWL